MSNEQETDLAPEEGPDHSQQEDSERRQYELERVESIARVEQLFNDNLAILKEKGYVKRRQVSAEFWDKAE